MKHLFTTLLAAVILTASLYAQKTTVNVASDFGVGEGSLNNAVQAAIDAGTLSNTIFMLEPYGLYILTGAIVVPAGEHLEVAAPEPGNNQEASPPQILWTASGGVTTDFIFECYGDLTLKNVWLMYGNTGGAQVGSQIRFFDDPEANASGKGEVGVFENVLFDYSSAPPTGAGGAVTVAAAHFKGTFKNCYFRNCIDTHLRYYGRALSFPYQSTGWHYDDVLFENCTFANMGYVFMQEGGEYGDNVHFNHCTFLNVMMFTLQTGWWYKMSTTNSIFVNTFMFGDNPAQREEGDFNGGTVRIDSVANFPHAVTFTEQDRRILFANNNYFLEAWLVDWMKNSPWAKFLRANRRNDEIPVPQPMLSPGTLVFFDSVLTDGSKAFPYMNRANLYDNTDPGFLLATTNLDSLKPFLNCKWDTNCDHNWAYDPAAGTNQIWPVNEDLSYTNETLKTAGMGGFPLGDLYHWWPDKYVQWKAQEDAEHDRIFTWLETGVDPGVTSVEDNSGNAVPASFTLSQNYPNPFNPTTQIEYSVPRTAHVSLKVYNGLGQEIATLFEGIRQAGNYVATFDGRELGNGVYFYRLQSGSDSIMRKFVLMK